MPLGRTEERTAGRTPQQLGLLLASFQFLSFEASTCDEKYSSVDVRARLSGEMKRMGNGDSRADGLSLQVRGNHFQQKVDCDSRGSTAI